MKQMRDIPHYDECVKFALKMKGIEGDSFKDTILRVYERRTLNTGTLFIALEKGGIIIPAICASLFGGNSTDVTASVVVKADAKQGIVKLYISETSEIQSFPVVSFMESWETTGGMCTKAFPADSNTYYPKLLNLKHVELPKGYEELHEAIAENAHDMWALERQSEGWTYGPKRDDSKLETPDMVRYSQLPESEKEYDRMMAEDTLKLLIALGCRIDIRIE